MDAELIHLDALPADAAVATSRLDAFDHPFASESSVPDAENPAFDTDSRTLPGLPQDFRTPDPAPSPLLPPALPPLPALDAHLLTRYFQMRENLDYLATESKRPEHELRLWLSNPLIQAHIAHHRATRAAARRENALEALHRIVLNTQDHIELRRAATALLRAESQLSKPHRNSTPIDDPSSPSGGGAGVFAGGGGSVPPSSTPPPPPAPHLEAHNPSPSSPRGGGGGAAVLRGGGGSVSTPPAEPPPPEPSHTADDCSPLPAPSPVPRGGGAPGAEAATRAATSTHPPAPAASDLAADAGPRISRPATPPLPALSHPGDARSSLFTVRSKPAPLHRLPVSSRAPPYTSPPSGSPPCPTHSDPIKAWT